MNNSKFMVDFTARIGNFPLTVRFAADPGITVLFGPSGCGKSSTLDCLAGLLTPKSGHIRFAEQSFFDRDADINLPPQRRQIGYVFQNPSLFPHLSVTDNIAFGLSRMSRIDRYDRVAELIQLLQLKGLEGRRPHEISGGQQQRVALARALAISPRILLLDEPFGSLDDDLRKQLGDELLQIQQQLNLTIIFVTHSCREAAALGQYVVQMEAGAVKKTGLPQAVLAV